MKKKIILSILTTITVMTGVLGSAYAAGVIKLNVNGSNLQTEVAPKVVNNRVMVPISFVSKALGASVSWNGKTQTVSINTIGIPNENVWDEGMDKLGSFHLASINNTVQVFLTGIDTGDVDLLEKSTIGLDLDRLKQEHNSMGPTMLSTKILDMKTYKKDVDGLPMEYLVRVGIQSHFGQDDLKVDYWDLTVRLAPLIVNGNSMSTEGKMEFVVIKREVVKSNPVDVHRVFPGYTLGSSK
ncbi:copper amine oxidase N-terminal domain-containing protein [Paenibacillus tarimensis]|uniref:copper amine oxidase N-terminal domain-containing protein n=1 Tax=Paenibacillus tarimensis TaxID=416012 RepID=UPI001F362A9A|nr:copper amine oxidase N-terminal domain-containing protein [Paenibacillus tarimensis]MCF2945375.1 copper amine oxidase N-terminal domain-containing protein [Paenibacillus tarimensis]